MNNKTAIILGGGISGLLVSKVLSKKYEKVIIIEKDELEDRPEVRQGQSHAGQFHVLLLRGLNTMERYFQGITEELKDGGAVDLDLGDGAYWYSYGGVKQNIITGINTLLSSRKLIDYTVRKRVEKIPNVQIVDKTRYIDLIEKNGTIIGVKVKAIDTEEYEIESDLVIDATGRGTLTPKWLENNHYPKPEEEKTIVNITYKTAIYNRPVGGIQQGKMMMYSPKSPEKIGVVIQPIENNKNLVCVAGWHKEDPPTDEDLMEFLKQLPDQRFYNVLAACQKESDFVTYKFPFCLRKYFEKLSKFPKGFLPIGDVFCNLNPAHGQGITSACLQVEILEELIEKHDPANMSKIYFKKVSKVLDQCWNASAFENFRYEETIGKKPKGVNTVNKYMVAIHKAANKNASVYAELVKVSVMIKPAINLFSPNFLWKVFMTNVRK
jgi:flavin-dependent dehydrogenase